MPKRLFLASLAASALTIAAQASEPIANLAADFDMAGAKQRKTEFKKNGWSFATKAGAALTYDTDLIDNEERDYKDGPLEAEGIVAGFNTDADLFKGFLPGFPLISNKDIFSRGHVAQEGDIVAFHAGDDHQNEQLVITWTADKDYTDVVLDYEIERLRGLHEDEADNVNHRKIAMDVTGPSGKNLLSLLPTTANGRLFTDKLKADKYGESDDQATHETLMIGDVEAGQTIVITIGGGGDGPGGDGSVGNFIISGN